MAIRDFYGRSIRDQRAAQNTFDPRKLGAKCDICPLRAFGPPVRGEGPKDSKIAFVCEAPGRKEQEIGRLLVGASGELFETWLGQLGLRRSAVRIDTALLCMPPGGELESFEKEAKREAKARGEDYVSPIACCRPRLFSELRVEKCQMCSRFRLGPKDERCACGQGGEPVQPDRWQGWESGGQMPEVIVPLGNAALLALTGLKGITNWRGSPLEF